VKNSATTLSRMNFSQYIGYIDYVSLNAYYCMMLVVGLWLGVGLVLGLVSGWLVVMHTYLYYVPLSLSPKTN